MIYVITGKIGGGKTLLALGKIIDVLAKGGCVVTNIALDEIEVDAWLKRCHGRRLVEGQIIKHDFEEKPEFHLEIPFGVPALNVAVFCDEAQLYYNQAQSSALQARLLKLVSFLTQSRKCCVDVWFITQHDTTIWAQFRHQALFGYKCRDMRVVSLPFFGQIGALGLCWVKYDLVSGEIMERGRTPLDKRVFKLYDTRQMYDAQMRELQGAARVWEPVDKKEKGKYEVDTDCSGSARAPWWVRLESLLLFRGKAADRDRGGAQEGPGEAGEGA